MSEQRRTMYPTLRYLDADKAIAFLKEAFGFEEHSVHRDDDGRISHAELTYDGGMVMIGQGEVTVDAPDVTKGGRLGVYLAVDDIDAHHARASAAAADVLGEIVEQPYGSREYGAKDPEGITWWFGTYRP